MATELGLSAVRRVRELISREVGNDPARLVARYMERQRSFEGRLIHGEPTPSESIDPPLPTS